MAAWEQLSAGTPRLTTRRWWMGKKVLADGPHQLKNCALAVELKRELTPLQCSQVVTALGSLNSEQWESLKAQAIPNYPYSGPLFNFDTLLLRTLTKGQRNALRVLMSAKHQDALCDFLALPEGLTVLSPEGVYGGRL